MYMYLQKISFCGHLAKVSDVNSRIRIRIHPRNVMDPQHLICGVAFWYLVVKFLDVDVLRVVHAIRRAEVCRPSHDPTPKNFRFVVHNIVTTETYRYQYLVNYLYL